MWRRSELLWKTFVTRTLVCLFRSPCPQTSNAGELLLPIYVAAKRLRLQLGSALSRSLVQSVLHFSHVGDIVAGWTWCKKASGKFKPVWVEIEQVSEQLSLYNGPPCGELGGREESVDCRTRRSITTISLFQVNVQDKESKKEGENEVILKIKVLFLWSNSQFSVFLPISEIHFRI